MSVGSGGEQGSRGIAHQRAVVLGDPAGLFKPVEVRIPFPGPLNQRLIAVQVVQVAASAGDGAAGGVGVNGGLHGYGGQRKNREKTHAITFPFPCGISVPVKIKEHTVQTQEESGQKEGFRPVCLLIRHQLFKQEHKA